MYHKSISSTIPIYYCTKKRENVQVQLLSVFSWPSFLVLSAATAVMRGSYNSITFDPIAR